MMNLYQSIYLFFADTTINLPHTSASSAKVQDILTIVFGIAGALALLMVVVSGLRFIISSGNPQEVTKAKNALVYSVAGLAICILAEVIVTFVVGHIF